MLNTKLPNSAEPSVENLSQRLTSLAASIQHMGGAGAALIARLSPDDGSAEDLDHVATEVQAFSSAVGAVTSAGCAFLALAAQFELAASRRQLEKELAISEDQPLSSLN